MSEKIIFAEIAAKEIQDRLTEKEDKAKSLENKANEFKGKADRLKRLQYKMFEGTDRTPRPIEESLLYRDFQKNEKECREGAAGIRRDNLSGKNEDEQAFINSLLSKDNIRKIEENKGIDARYYALLYKAGSGEIGHSTFEKESSEVISRSEKEKGILSVDKKLLEDISTVLLLLEKIVDLERGSSAPGKFGEVARDAAKYEQIARQGSMDAENDAVKKQYQDLASKLSSISYDYRSRKANASAERASSIRENVLAIIVCIIIFLLGPGFGKGIGYTNMYDDIFFALHDTLYKYIPVAATLTDQKGRIYFGFGDLYYEPEEKGLPLIAPFAKLHILYKNVDDKLIEVKRGKYVSVSNCNNLETLKISSMDADGDVSIYDNSVLKKVVIDADIKSLSVRDCPELSEIVINGAVNKSIDLKSCKSLRTLSLPENEMEEISIVECTTPTSLVLPKSVSHFEMESCPDITSLVINDVTSYNSYAVTQEVKVNSCENLKKVELKGTVDDSSEVLLTNINPESVEVSGDIKGFLTIENFSADTNIDIRGTVRELRLWQCDDEVLEYTVPEGNISSLLVGQMNGVTSIVIPKTIHSVSVQHCPVLTKVTIFDGTIFTYDSCESLNEDGVIILQEEQ